MNYLYESRRGQSRSLKAVAAAIALLCGTPALAGETIEFDNGIKVDWLATVGYTTGMRLKAPDPALTGAFNPAGDDGNLNFKKHALINNRISLLAEANVQKGATGFFIRGSSFYDDVYRRSNDNPYGPFDFTSTINKFGPANEFSPEARKYQGGWSRLLDAYAYTTVGLGAGSSLNLRLGKHIVSWGESTFFPNISGAQSPSDGAKAVIPGAEVKDVLLPVNQFSANYQVNSNWTVMGYAQFDSKPVEVSPVGSFLSESDVFGPGATCTGPVLPIGPGGTQACTFGPRTADQKAKDSGQWGIGTRYRFSPTDEVGLYYLNYHDRIGMPIYTIDALLPTDPFVSATYRIQYLEDIKLAGVSYSTRLGDWQISSELSYKDGVPVLVRTGGFPTPSRAKATQFNLSGMRLMGASFIADQLLLLGEISTLNVRGVDPIRLPSSGAAAATVPFLPAAMCGPIGICSDSTDLMFSRNSMAYTLMTNLTYTGVFPGWDLDVPITFQHQVKGRPPVSGAFGGLQGEGDKRLNIGAVFTYLGKLQVGFNYVSFLNSPVANSASTDARLFTDRDYVSATVKYTF